MIIMIFLFILFISANIAKSNNRKYIYGLLSVIWLLFAFSYDTADYAIYTRRFDYPDKEFMEPFFLGFISLCKSLGLDLDGLVFLTATIYVFTLFKYISSNNQLIYAPGLVLSLYSIYPLIMDINQIRNTISFIPIIYGLKFLNDRTIFGDIKFSLCIIVSALFHFSGLFYVLMLLAKRLTLKHCIFITVFFSILGILLTSNLAEMIYAISSLLSFDQKVATLLSNQVMQQINTIKGTQLMLIVTAILIQVIIYFSHIPKHNSDNIFYDKNFAIKLNLILLILVPLVYFAVDLFRIQRYMLLIFYIIVSNSIILNSEHLSRYSIYNIYAKVMLLSIPVLDFYINIIRSDIFDNVINGVFIYNKISTILGG